MVWRKRQCVALLGNYAIAAGIGMLLVINVPAMEVHANEKAYSLVYGSADESEEYYVRLHEYGENYEVMPGDTLWDIAEQLWGEGKRYRELANLNQDVISDPNVIYPGIVLQTGRECYIVNHKQIYEGFNTPSGWTVGYVESGDYYANFAMFGGSGKYIVCKEESRSEEVALALADWEKCESTIRAYVDQQYHDTVEDLSFEHYQTENGHDVCMYSFIYLFDASEYGQNSTLKINVSVGIKMTEYLQAQFIGFAYGDDMKDYVRYVASVNTDTSDRYSYFGNMEIGPSENWDVDGLVDPFAWIHGFHDARLREILDIPPEDQSVKESLLNRMHRN